MYVYILHLSYVCTLPCNVAGDKIVTKIVSFLVTVTKVECVYTPNQVHNFKPRCSSLSVKCDGDL